MQRLLFCCLSFAAFCAAQEPAAPADPAPAATPAAPVTVKVKGRVLDYEGQPIGDVAIGYGPLDDYVTSQLLDKPQVQSGADGRFEFEFTPPPDPKPGESTPPTPYLFLVKKGLAGFGRALYLQREELRYDDDGYDPQEQKPPYKPETDLGTLQMMDGARMFGRVRDPDGKPLAGVRVVARDLFDQNRCFRGRTHDFLCTAVTDASGIFSLPGSLPQGVVLSCSLDGWFQRSMQPVATSTPLEIEMQKSGWIAGRVLDAEGRGMADAYVNVAYEVKTASKQVRTGADGSFRTTQASPGRWRLTARGKVGDDWITAQSEVLTGAHDNLEVAAKKAEDKQKDNADDKLIVRAVAKGDKQPITGFRAVAIWDEYASRNAPYLEYRIRMEQRRARKEKDGSIELNGPGKQGFGTGAIRVFAKGFAAKTVSDYEWKDVPAGKQREALVAEMEPEAVLAGVVKDETSGEPVADAKVWVRPWFDPNQGNYNDGEEYPFDAVTTAKDGSFRIGQLGEGKWQVRVRHKQRPVVPPEDFELKAAEQKLDLVLKMPVGARVAGTLTGGTIGTGWRVFLHPLPKINFGGRGYYSTSSYSSNDSVPKDAVAVGDDGRFAFEGVRLGNYLLVLVLPSAPRCGGELFVPLEPFRVRPQGIDRPFDIAADQPGTISGKITFTQAAVPFHRLVVVAQQISEDNQMFFSPYDTSYVGPRAFVDPGGNFSLRTGPGTYQLLLVDTATNVRLDASSKPIKVEPNQDASCDFTSKLFQVAIQLVPEKEGQPMAMLDRLELRVVPKVKDNKNNNNPFGGNDNFDFGIGVDLLPAQTTVEVVVPDSTVTVMLRNSVASIRIDEQRGNQAPIGRGEFETSDKENADKVTIKVGEPPEIPKPDDKKDADGN